MPTPSSEQAFALAAGARAELALERSGGANDIKKNAENSLVVSRTNLLNTEQGYVSAEIDVIKAALAMNMEGSDGTEPELVQSFYTTYDPETKTHNLSITSTQPDSGEISQPLQLSITEKKTTFLYKAPPHVGQGIQYPTICDSSTTDNQGFLPEEAHIKDCCNKWWNVPDTFRSCNLTPSYNPWYIEANGFDASSNPVPYPNIPYYKTDFRITGNFDAGNEKDIMITWALIMDGKYRENELDAGVLNYVEKYVRTSGNAPDGLYCYNFALESSPFIFQPSGAMNVNKFKTVEFEVSTFTPPSDPNAETLTICDSDGNIVGVNKPVWRIYDYTYNLVVMEERYNVLKFVSGNAALAYAR